MAENLCDALGNCRTWSHALGISDHKEIILQLDFDKRRSIYSFKFNPIWLEDNSLCDMVKEKWSSWSDRIFSSKLDGVIIKLSLLKNEVSVWEKAKKREERRRLEEIDTEMQMLMGMVDELFFSFDRKKRELVS